MEISYSPYKSLKKWRNQYMAAHQSSTDGLHSFHDHVLKAAFTITLEKIKVDVGPPPCEFTWFVMGSAGRCEQANISDQDHGIIYEEPSQAAFDYFLTFGKILSNGLDYIGYPYCDGQVMSSNPLWCQSKQEWQQQIRKWIDDDGWESYRHLIILTDARAIAGKIELVTWLKQDIFQLINQQPYYLYRLMENTRYIEKALGIFHQFLPLSSGPYTGTINLKQTAFFPYVNATRLLAIKENIFETSTLMRLSKLASLHSYENLERYKVNFSKLLQIRLDNRSRASYVEGHYFPIKILNSVERHEIKRIILEGIKLFHYVESIVKRAVKNEI